jgi:hypothetical protein
VITKFNFTKEKKNFRISKQDRKKNCYDLPNTFWKRKQHVVNLRYDDSVNEKKIPNKATTKIFRKS